MEAPHDNDFERRVLARLVAHEDEREEMCSRLTPDDFYDADHAILFSLIRTKTIAGDYVDAEILLRELDGASKTENSPATLIGAILDLSHTVTAPAAREYIRRVRALAHARTIIQTGNRLVAAGHEAGADQESINAALQNADQIILETTDRVVDTSWSPLGPLIQDFEVDEGLDPIFKTGLYDVDRVLNGGFRPGQCVIVAGRPAAGKSTLGAQIAQHASIHQNVPGLFVSLEMSEQEIASRVIATQGNVDLQSIMRNELTDEDQDAIDSLRDRMSQKASPPLYVLDSTASDFPTIRAEILAAHRRLNIGYVVIDYLQLMGGGSDRRSDSRQEEIAQISRGVKMLAKQLGIVAIVVAQLNRGPESRTGRRPAVADLRESGQLEQDADIIMLLHRPETYDPVDRPGEADVIIGKHRNGHTADVPVLFLGQYTKFASLSPEEEPSAR